MGRTIPTCSKLALVLALLAPLPVAAKRLDVSALGVYARARVADGQKDSASAVANYKAALTMASDATTVAFRAYRAGVDGGDYKLALRAAQALDRLDIVPPDARVLLYIAAVRDRDWAGARTRLDQLRNQDGFSFLAPLLDDWLSIMTPIDIRVPDLGNAYGPENDALLAIARGNYAQGATAVRILWPTDAYRAGTLRLAAASSLAAHRQRDLALSLLTTKDETIVAGRAAIARGGHTRLTVDTPARAAAFLLSRMASDLTTHGSSRSAVTLARLATFADPENPQIALVMATALATAKRYGEAMTLVDDIRRDPVYGGMASSLRIDYLDAMGQFDEAYAEAGRRAAQSTTDESRLGDLAARHARYAEAVGHYRSAINAIGEDNAGPALWLALGNAYDLGGDWKNARAALERTKHLSPDDPRLLNQLGYGMARRGEDIDEALLLLRKADRLLPENAAITDSLGWAQYRSGDIDGAIVVLERARMLDPAEPEIAEHLGDAYWAGGRRIEARYAWRAAQIGAAGNVATRLDAKIDRGLP